MMTEGERAVWAAAYVSARDFLRGLIPPAFLFRIVYVTVSEIPSRRRLIPMRIAPHQIVEEVVKLGVGVWLIA